MKKTPIEKILSNVSIDDNGCWVFAGSKTKSGYGDVRIKDKIVYVHRYVYVKFYGEIPDGFCVCHHCDNPPCCNPNHLFIATHKQNMQDRGRKGRGNPVRGEQNGNAKLTYSKVKEIRELISLEFTHQKIADKFSVSTTTISKIRTNKMWVAGK